MAEGGLDQKEVQVNPRVERIKAGIVKWVENQMPPAASERHRKFYTRVAERLTGKNEELMAKLQPVIEGAAKVTGVAEPVVKVILATTALYGGVNLLLHPQWFAAIGGVAAKAWMAGTAAIAGGFHYVVEKGGALVDRVKAIVGNILNPTSPFGGLGPDERGIPSISKNILGKR